MDALAAFSRHDIKAPKREAELEDSSTETETATDCAMRGDQGPPVPVVRAPSLAARTESCRGRCWSAQQWRSRQQGNRPAKALGTKQQTLVGSVMPAVRPQAWSAARHTQSAF